MDRFISVKVTSGKGTINPRKSTASILACEMPVGGSDISGFIRPGRADSHIMIMMASIARAAGQAMLVLRQQLCGQRIGAACHRSAAPAFDEAVAQIRYCHTVDRRTVIAVALIPALERYIVLPPRAVVHQYRALGKKYQIEHIAGLHGLTQRYFGEQKFSHNASLFLCHSKFRVILILYMLYI